MTDITPEQLSAYLDDALAPAERSAVEKALADSPALRRELDALRRTQSWVRELPPPGVPTGFEQRVLRTIQKPRARTNWWIVAPSAFGAAATALLMVLVIRQDRPHLSDNVRALAPRQIALPVGKAATSSPLETRGRLQKDKKMEEPPFRREAVHPAGEADALRLDETAQRAGPSTPAPAEALRDDQTPSRIGGAAPSLPAALKRSSWDQEKETSSVFGSAELADRSSTERKIQREGTADFKNSVASTTREWRGGDSGITVFREVVIRTGAEWRALWKEHTAPHVPPPPVPPVDFTTSQVVGVFLGQRSSGGYAVDILSLSDAGNALTVTYRETRPAAGTLQITVLTQPFHLRVVPRREGPVRFKKD